MDSSELKLQNTEAFVGLVGNHSIARPGDTSKYFLDTTTSNEPERIFVDGCTSDANTLFSVGNLHNYVQHAVQGGTSALFLSGCGITRMGDYDRKQFMSSVCASINTSMAQYDPDLSMTYAFVGVTDSKVVDFHRDRTITTDRLQHGLGALQHEVDDWEMVEEKIMKGATLPFVLSLHFESLSGEPTNGHLCVVDMNVVSWAEEASDAVVSDKQPNMLQQSTQTLANLIHMLANDTILTGVTLPFSALISLVGEFLYGESKTAFVFILNTDERATNSNSSDIAPLVSVIKSIRKLKSRSFVRAVDRRVLFFYEKAKYYQAEKYRLQDELHEVTDEKEHVERDLDDVQRDFGEEREALAREVGHWQKRSGELEATLESLRAESAGNEADARWENARLVTDKLAIKDELRRAEIEMAAAEDSKSKLLDLYESLQTSYASLDAVYAELLAAYRHLKDCFGQLSDERDELLQQTEDLERQALHHVEQIDALRTKVAQTTEDRDQRIDALEAQHARVVEQLEVRLAAESQQVRELHARVASLETTNKSLTAPQTEETATLQSTITDLSAKLESAELASSTELTSTLSALRAAENTAKRLATEKARLEVKVSELTASTDAQAEISEREAQWQREREQMQRQIKRLQKTAESSQLREAELRDESERQWSSWEDEKLRNHEKYLALKTKFRQAVEFAADVQVRLDSERETGTATVPVETPVQAPGDSDIVMEEAPAPVVAKKPANGRARPRKAPAKRAKPPPAKSVSFTGSDGSDAEAPAPRRSSSVPGSRRPPVNYAEPDISDITTAAADPIAPSSGGMARAPANSNSDSDDSEISFNPRAISPVAPKKKRRAVRPRKSAAELNAELTTMPARKRPATANTANANNNVDDILPPKRKRAPKSTANSRATRDADSEPTQTEPPAQAEAIPSLSIIAGATTLKKKRKLNLSRMRNLLGIGADRPPATTSDASAQQAIKFTVPKIRSAASAAAAEPQDADSD
ncbi:hypothetical protein GGF43_002157 [Coemansia sp. RSA 2618]|nr:hypothetical protein GGF43_002157 [Coemansia sp. RSA 2618]